MGQMAESSPARPSVAPDFASLFRVLPSPYMILDRNLRYVEVNDAYCAVLERSREALIGAYLFDAFPDAGESGRRLRASFERALETGQPDSLPLIPYPIERPAARGGGFEMRYWSAVHTPLLDADGRTAFIVQQTIDVTDRVLAERQEKLLVEELDHRVKNTLATVQAIAQQTLRSAADPAAFQAAFQSRLLALSRTHDLLTARNWRGAALRDVLMVEFGPYAASQYQLSGEEVELSPPEALAFGLVIHELATNAAKYGALSTHDGCVTVEWRVEDGRLALTWRERGGPRVEPPQRRGFGSRLIERSLRGQQLDGAARLDFDPEGLACHIELPLSPTSRPGRRPPPGRRLGAGRA